VLTSSTGSRYVGQERLHTQNYHRERFRILSQPSLRAREQIDFFFFVFVRMRKGREVNLNQCRRWTRRTEHARCERARHARRVRAPEQQHFTRRATDGLAASPRPRRTCSAVGKLSARRRPRARLSSGRGALQRAAGHLVALQKTRFVARSPLAAACARGTSRRKPVCVRVLVRKLACALASCVRVHAQPLPPCAPSPIAGPCIPAGPEYA